MIDSDVRLWEEFSTKKFQREKFVKGVHVRSGRTVRASRCKTNSIPIDDTHNVYTYTFPNGMRYSDKGPDQIKCGEACCGHSHICILILDTIIKRRGRNIKVLHSDLDLDV